MKSKPVKRLQKELNGTPALKAENMKLQKKCLAYETKILKLEKKVLAAEQKIFKIQTGDNTNLKKKMKTPFEIEKIHTEIAKIKAFELEHDNPPNK